jgi:hypothetical protein
MQWIAEPRQCVLEMRDHQQASGDIFNTGHACAPDVPFLPETYAPLVQARRHPPVEVIN